MDSLLEFLTVACITGSIVIINKRIVEIRDTLERRICKLEERLMEVGEKR